jgi:hypothetical protein
VSYLGAKVAEMYSDPANHTAVIHVDVMHAGADGTSSRRSTPMHSRLIRLDAMVFRADSVRFEACPTFRGSDGELCDCGWLEADHSVAVGGRQFAGRRPRRRPAIAAQQTA